jgi:hypothetical protein
MDVPQCHLLPSVQFLRRSHGREPAPYGRGEYIQTFSVAQVHIGVDTALVEASEVCILPRTGYEARRMAFSTACL